MRRAVVADFGALPGVEVRYTLDSRYPSRRGSLPIGPGEEAGRFVELARTADAVLVIAPETSGVLAARERLLRRVGVPSLGGSPRAVETAGDKLAASRRLAVLGVPVVPTRRHGPRRSPPSQPSVLKPRDGAGSIATVLVPPGEPWPALGGGLIAQPFLTGRPASAAAILSRCGSIRWIGAASQKVTIVAGRFAYRGGSVPHRFPRALRAALTRALPDWPGLAGWVGIDYIWDPGRRRAVVLEVNPRLTTSYLGHRARLGGPWIAAAWLHAAGLGPAPGRRPGPLAAAVHFRADGRITRPC